MRTPLLALALIAVALLAGCHEPATLPCPVMMDMVWDQPGLYAAIPASAEGLEIEAREADGYPFEHPTHGTIGISAVHWYQRFGGFTQPIFFVAAENRMRPDDQVVLEVLAGADDDWVRSVFLAFVMNITEVQAATQHAWADGFVASRAPGGSMPIVRTHDEPAPAADRFHVAVHGPYRFEEHYRAAAPEESLRELMVMTTSNAELTNQWAYGFELAKMQVRTTIANHTVRLTVDEHDHAQFHMASRGYHVPTQDQFYAALMETLDRLGVPYPEGLIPSGSTC